MNRLGHPIISKIICALGLFVAASQPLSAEIAEHEETIPKAYSKDYVFLTMPYEQPYGKSRSLYSNDTVGAGIRYAHRLDSEWIVGLKFERKPVIRKDDKPMNLLVFSNQTQAVFRLYHPLYILVGTEISYVLPATKSSPPFTKDPDFDTEIAVGLNTSLWWLTSRKGIVELNLSRWKGTKTNNLQGLETSLGYGIGF
ncbi:MAG: hypothetical protein EOP07_07165 [Proteobacteria bacterium]|nr:MAG: hypothetical protein EOP07_07165 [Pseudomonadota bacterium]